jgi:hypothetical protein
MSQWSLPATFGHLFDRRDAPTVVLTIVRAFYVSCRLLEIRYVLRARIIGEEDNERLEAQNNVIR